MLSPYPDPCARASNNNSSNNSSSSSGSSSGVGMQRGAISSVADDAMMDLELTPLQARWVVNRVAAHEDADMDERSLTALRIAMQVASDWRAGAVFVGAVGDCRLMGLTPLTGLSFRNQLRTWSY
jgi:hypothetical protein